MSPLVVASRSVLSKKVRIITSASSLVLVIRIMPQPIMRIARKRKKYRAGSGDADNVRNGQNCVADITMRITVMMNIVCAARARASRAPFSRAGSRDTLAKELCTRSMCVHTCTRANRGSRRIRLETTLAKNHVLRLLRAHVSQT